MYSDNDSLAKVIVPYHQQEKTKRNIFISSACNCTKSISVTYDESISNGSKRFQWCSKESDQRDDHQLVVTYNLFGDVENGGINSRYFSLMRNISLAIEEYYPGWIMRIYHSFTENDRKAYQSLCDIYCQFPHVDLCSVTDIWQQIGNETTPIDPALIKGLNKRMYRFLVMLDHNVDVFISRDIDSFVITREIDAVREWLQSNFTFHLMRDNPWHTDMILAGNGIL